MHCFIIILVSNSKYVDDSGGKLIYSWHIRIFVKEKWSIFKMSQKA